MFTGIIEDVGMVKSISDSKISISTKLNDIKIGDSIAVNGVCLTAAIVGGEGFSADYSPQTDRLTNLTFLRAQSFVNLESALTLSKKLGGHIVTGHVDAMAKIESVKKLDRFYAVRFYIDETKYLVDKGSIAIDGISLTIANISGNIFEVFIIPQTYENTILKYRKVGDLVNIETDVLAKYVEKFIVKENADAKVYKALKENGFL